MNPSPDLYMEYYSDYDFQDNNGEENYDHIGDIEQLVNIFLFLDCVLTIASMCKENYFRCF